MEKMTKTERVKAALAKQDVDRMPISIWHHMPDVDQDPVELAERTLELTKRFDYDFIKMMPFGNYGAQDYGLSVKFYCTATQTAKERKFAINDAREWLDIEPLPAYYGTYGKQVQFTRHLRKLLGKTEIPYIQTIFSPLTTAKKLAGERVFTDMKEHPTELHHALAAITQTTINFCKANIEEGVAGFFFASQCSRHDLMTEDEYDEFGKKYDLEVMKHYVNDTYFNVVHIHGDNTMFKKMADYPCNCISWHDRWVKPNLEEARKLTDKCFLGGLNERWFETADYTEVRDHLAEAVRMNGRRGLILGPGCVAKLKTPMINFYAARIAVETL